MPRLVGEDPVEDGARERVRRSVAVAEARERIGEALGADRLEAVLEVTDLGLR